MSWFYFISFLGSIYIAKPSAKQFLNMSYRTQMKLFLDERGEAISSQVPKHKQHPMYKEAVEVFIKSFASQRKKVQTKYPLNMLVKPCSSLSSKAKSHGIFHFASPRPEASLAASSAGRKPILPFASDWRDCEMIKSTSLRWIKASRTSLVCHITKQHTEMVLWLG